LKKEKINKFFQYLITPDVLNQIAIAVFGLTAGILLAFKIKWAYVFGILSQPFWYYFSLKKKQYGIFILNIFYTITWIIGFYNWFFK
jgi:nicotinamide riboside transporter PnuC